MEYLLSEKEYYELTTAPKAVAAAYEKIVNELCTIVADSMPLPDNWINSDLEEGEAPAPWNCVHSMQQEWYCDDYPVQEHCTQSKHWSK